MNLSTPVGRACRRSLPIARKCPSQITPYTHRATFLSLRSQNPLRTSTEQAGDDVAPAEGDSRRHSIPNTRLPLPRRKPISRATNSNPADLLESLFEQSVAPPDVEQDRAQILRPSLERYKTVEMLKSMLVNETDPVDSWDFFVQHFSLHSGNHSQETIPSYLLSTAKQLLRQVIDAKVKTPISGGLPTCTAISTIYAQLGILHEADWAELMQNLLSSLWKMKQGGKQSADVSALFDDLLGSWNAVCTQISTREPPVDSLVLDWSSLPQLLIGKGHGPLQALTKLTGSLKGRRGDDIALVGVASLILLAKHCPTSHKALRESSRFVQALNIVVNSVTDIKAVIPKSPLDGTARSELTRFVLEEWPQLNSDSDMLLSPQLVSYSGTASFSSTVSRDQVVHHDIAKRIKAAARAQDLAQLDLMWADAASSPLDPQAKGYKRGFLTSALCDIFIGAYNSNKKLGKAIDVWNFMISQGLAPTVSTWTAMLSGARVKRDVRAIEGIWQKMEHSGLKPDLICWSSRICGLIECGKDDEALKALDDMGRRWIVAVQMTHGKLNMDQMQAIGDVNGIPKPSINIINSTILGFLRRRKPQAAYRVLGWASKFGISPDVTTYNILLRPLIRDGHAKNAAALLRQMHSAGVEADVVTFTTILDEILTTSESSTPEAMRQTISDVFSYMDETGVQATSHTYSKLIHHMLQQPTGGLLAVNVIMERMAKEGLQPSPYVYTPLVQHYFNEQPPNLEAVDSLIERARRENTNMDHIFWDRVIEGYARAGDTASALRVLGKINSQGGKAGWYTLKTLLNALTEGEEWEAARTLVRNTKVDHGGPLPDDVRGQDGQHQFWNFAMGLGLVE
jgi:pentatricopeptide repeat protein